MDDCIFRKKLLEHIKDLPTWWSDGSGIYSKPMKYPDGMFYCEDVVASIENAPAADVEPIKHGHWISRPDCGVTVCSVCHRSVEEAVDYPRCMFCGAIMDEEDENDQ